MKNLIENYWRQLQGKVAEDQMFYLFLMLIFANFRNQQNVQIIGDFTQKSFKQSFNDVYDYDVREAVHRFSEKVDWILIENNREIQESLQKAKQVIFSYLNDGGCKMVSGKTISLSVEKLDDLVEIVSELYGNSIGYSSTPGCIQQLVIDLLGNVRAERFSDFCCGTAVFGARLWRNLARRNPKISFHGVDVDYTLCDIAKIMLFVHDIQSGEVEQRDLLALPETQKGEQPDFIVMDIPRGNNKSESYDDRDFRLMNFNKKSIYTDWIFIQEALYRLSNHGYAVILATTGALIRTNEKIIREQIVMNDWLEAVITLPPNLYPSTRTGTELLIFHKGKSEDRRNKILFIDVSQYFYRGKRNSYIISEEGQRLARDCFRYKKEIEGVSVIRETRKLDSSTYSLKPVQYIQQKMELQEKSNLCLCDIAEIIRGAQVLAKDNNCPDGLAYFINIKDIQEQRICYDTADKINPGHQAYKEKFRIYEDDILITSKGALTKTAIVESDGPLAFISGNITLLRVNKNKYNSYVLFEYLNSEQGQIALDRIQSGTTIRILSNANLRELKVPEYSQELMHRVGEELKKKRTGFYRSLKELTDTYQKERSVLLEILKEG